MGLRAVMYGICGVTRRSGGLMKASWRGTKGSKAGTKRLWGVARRESRRRKASWAQPKVSMGPKKP